LKQLLSADPTLWKKEMAEVGKYLEQYGKRLPAQMLAQLKDTRRGWGVKVRGSRGDAGV